MSINPEQSSVFESNTESLDSLRKDLDILVDRLKALEEEIAILKKVANLYILDTNRALAMA